MHALHDQIDRGTLFVAPSELAQAAASRLAKRFSHPLWRFTSSGTEATQTAVRLARSFTRRDKIIKVEGGYHGHTDTLLHSAKPALDRVGPAASPNTLPDSTGIPYGVTRDVIVVPFNDADALEHALLAHEGEVAAFIVEPVLENAGIILPVAGYLDDCRKLCDRFGALLIFDEVKTGLTASYNGAGGYFGVTPDITCLAKSIGGGVPIGAFGGREEVMRLVESDCVHHGTFNANPLVLAACIATLDVCTSDALEVTHRLNAEFAEAVDSLLEEVRDRVPTVVQTIGSKGSVTFSSDVPRSYRDWKNSDFLAAELFWLWSTNRGVLTPPGLDEQWLVSLAHTSDSLETYLTQLSQLVKVVKSL
jgi:glutamate-1-semialdehyde 2,1-aminomutase